MLVNALRETNGAQAALAQLIHTLRDAFSDAT
jgi:hypothetical protein